MKKLNLKKIKLIDCKNIRNQKIDNKSINLINVNFDQRKTFKKLQQNRIYWRMFSDSP